MMKRQVLDRAILDYDSSFLSQNEADNLFVFLKDNVAWEQKYYTYGVKQVAQPRLTAWFADNSNLKYSYSGVTQIIQPWLKELLFVKEKIEQISNSVYNSVLLNYYRNGKDSVAPHADDEKELGTNPNIASLSLGAVRPFILVKNNSPHVKFEFDLEHGSLLIMSGETQSWWKHSVPKVPNLQEGRINLTFRKIVV